MLSLLKSLMNGLNGKKKLDLTYLYTVNSNVTTWLNTSVKTCQVTSSLKTGWVQSYGMRGVKPPIIYGDVKHIEAVTVKETAYAQSLTNRPVKGMLTGPVTILNWSFERSDIPKAEIFNQIAIALKN